MEIVSRSGGKLVDEGLAGRVLSVQGVTLVQDQRLGRQALYMASYGSRLGMLIVLDYETNTVEEYEFAEGVTAWNLFQGQDGLVYIGAYSPAQILAFDTAERRFLPVPRTPALDPPASVICDLAQAADGTITFGTYPDCRLYRWTPGSPEIATIVRLAEDENYARYVTPLPDGGLLAFADCHCSRVAEVAPNGALRWLTPESAMGPSRSGALYLSGDYAAHVVRSRGSDTMLVVYDWRRGAYVGERNLGPGEFTVIEPTEDGLLLAVRGAGVVEVHVPTGEARERWPHLRIPDIAPGPLQLDDRGRLIGVAARHYWVADTETGAVEVRQLPARGAYIAPLGLEAMANGQVWGSYHLGQSLFRLPGDGSEATSYGPAVEIGGEPYDLEEHDGQLYFASYVEAVLAQFDPSEAWLPGPEASANPREIHRFISHQQYRPCAGLAWAPDGRLAMGTMARYGIAGGALILYDTDNSTWEVYRDPVPQQAVVCLDGDGELLCAGTSIHSNGVSAEGASARVFTWDVVAGAIDCGRELPGIESVSWLAALPERRVLLSAAGKLLLWRVDSDQLELVADPGVMRTNGAARSADGELWLILNGDLCRYDAAGDQLVHYDVGRGQLSAPLSVGPDGTVYAARDLGIVSFRPE